MEYKIIKTQEEHLPEIEAIEKECFSAPWNIEQLRSQLRGDRHEFIAAVDKNGRVLGYVGMMYVLDEGYISNVAVSSFARRQGIAEGLVRELLARAEKLELSFVTLEVRASNHGAIALYDKCGFKPVGRRKNYYQQPQEDAILMTCFMK